MKTIATFTFLLLLFAGIAANAQIGYSTASYAMSRSNGISSPEQIVVEEFLNYHKHNIRLPKAEEKIALSMDHLKLKEDEILVQVGIASSQLLDYSEMAPLNICLVIDRSGSMNSDERLLKVKKALAQFTKGLRKKDYISIVTYSTHAAVLVPSTLVENVPHLHHTIESIYANGSTNLYGGLELGYKQVLKHYKEEYTNKVILLTDGIANTGVHNPDSIAFKSSEYTKLGIDISTIGVGKDVNYELLQNISKTGRGANHFVGDSQEDITKVFETELESLLSPLAKSVHLEFTYNQDLDIKEIYGYEPEYLHQKVNIPLNNINSGLTQVILLRFKITEAYSEIPVKARLVFQTAQKLEANAISTSYTILTEKEITNKEVRKCYHIALMAIALQEYGQHISDKNYRKARNTLTSCLASINKEFPYLKDEDMLRVKAIVETNKNNIETYLEPDIPYHFHLYY